MLMTVLLNAVDITYVFLCRHHNLCNAQFTSADVDILYIDMSRRHGSTFERNAMSFHCFCHALMSIANKLYSGENTLKKLLDHCRST